MTNDRLISEWRSRLERTVPEAQALAGSLSRGQIEWNPAEGAWSVGQVLDHLSHTHEGYLPLIRGAIARSGSRPPRPWKPSLFGRMLERVILSPRKSSSPKTMRPSAATSAAPLERFLESVRAITAEMDRARAANLMTRTHSPAGRLLPINLGDALYLQGIHVERHLQQIRRVKEHTNFPG